MSWAEGNEGTPWQSRTCGHSRKRRICWKECFLVNKTYRIFVRGDLQYGLALEEAGLFREGVEHLGSRLVGGSIADLVAVADCDRHLLYFLLFLFIVEEYRLINILLYMQAIHPHHDIVFVRHGESLKNEAVQKYRHERNLPDDWSIFYKDPHFIKSVTHNPELIDCHLSPKGIQQCLQARQQLKDFHPDIILCSPLLRALQTTRLIFPGRKCLHVVEPLLSETFKHSSEVCRSIEVKKKQFAEFDFSRVEAEGQFWFIKNDSQENQKKYFQFLKQTHLEGAVYRQTVEKMCEFMSSQKLREKPSNVRERARKVKELLKEYRKQYKMIAVVSHFYTIKFLNTTAFNQDDEPVDKIHMKNCGIHATSLLEIEKNI